ncbi:putative [histone H3]-lysine(4) N-trimethyltransferase chromatin regulator PHD family [Helianthus annuus]|nr:putative [histone H3]-lysine(4) N-trimethyltransferase chromatin regulator PHD family [Helianthus annuus]KAJ0688693.1 putative [histone H3]-lysine(4) N-trimethyltransferase chromatin regulator PHD family [Helianthus annuus]KAJ0874392.1 putative histone-lysine N-methyltransferase [Helianthus annuus]
MKPSFIVDDSSFECDGELTTKGAEDSESDDVDDTFDTVCAICDNGGDLTCCEGRCLRSFHATVKSAKFANSSCKSLGLLEEEVKVFHRLRSISFYGSVDKLILSVILLQGSQPFLCLNCSHEQHQCFVCGKLGSSNNLMVQSSATCGHFYHLHCVAKLLEDENDTEEKIAGGKPFTCPAHECHKCKKKEDETVKGLQFAVCRRCPRSYHRKCLPSKIVFDKKDNDDGVIARAWNNLLPKSRALIYCL